MATPVPEVIQRLIFSRARAVLWLTAAATLFFASRLPSVRFENIPGQFDLPAADSTRATLDAFRREFNAGEVLIVGMELGRPAVAGDVATMRTLTDRLGRLEGVVSVHSLTSATGFAWTPSLGFAQLRTRPVLPASARVPDSVVTAILESLGHTPFYGDNLISADGREIAFVLTLDPDLEHGKLRTESARKLLLDIESCTRPFTGQGASFFVAGPAVLNTALQDAMGRDLEIFAPVSALAFAGILLWVFQRPLLVLVGFGTAVLALIWSLGTIALCGVAVSVGLSMIFPLMLSLTMAYTIHYLACFNRPHAGGGPAAESCCRAIVVPGLLCGVTTFVGFASLGTSALPGIRDVGLYVGLGVLACTWLSNVFIPALFARFPALLAASAQGSGRTGPIDRVVQILRGPTMKHPGRVVTVALVITAVAAIGLLRLPMETNHLRYLRNDRGVTRAFGFVDRNFGGVLPLEILVHVPETQAAEALLRMSALERKLRALPGVGSVLSVADLVGAIEAGAPRGIPTVPRIDLASGIFPGALWAQLEQSTLGESLLRRSGSELTLRIACRAHVAGSAELHALVAKVEAMVQDDLAGYRPEVTGLTAYFTAVERYLLSTQVRSFSLALVVTAILLGLFAGSWRAGLAVVAVNVVPIVVVLGIMGWASVPLDISTVMIASIALGIVVDDTLHLLFRYKSARARGCGVEAALQVAFTEVGVPITATTLVVFTGFAVLVFARFVPTQYFGGLSALTVLVAAGADMILLPSLLKVLLREAPPR